MTEFVTLLKETPLPTLLVVGGFVFLFIGITTIKKPIILDVTDSNRRIALVLGILLIAAGLSVFAFPTPGQSQVGATTSDMNKSTENKILSNLAQHIDFEQQFDKSITLGVCNNSASTPWYENCYEAPSKLVWEEEGYTGLHSLGIEIEALPDKEQAYTARWQLEPPVIASVVSAEVYVPDESFVHTINVAGWTEGGEQWKVTGLTIARSGWQHVLLDLQQFVDENEKLARENAITELHLDIFVSKSPEQAKESVVQIDDIYFFYPASKPYPTLLLTNTPAP